MVSHWMDMPNVLTLLGLSCGVVAVFYAIRFEYAGAMVALLLAMLFDLIDGPVARAMHRSGSKQAFGAQVDSFADLVSGAIAPGVLLLSVGNNQALFIPGALIIVAAGVTRLTCFNLYGLGPDGQYVGLPMLGNIIFVTLVFLFQGILPATVFQVLLYVAIVLVAVLNVASIGVPKPTGIKVVLLGVYAVGLATLYAVRG